MSLDFESNGFTGTYLVAMPAIRDATFGGTVVLICAHSSDGAMGLILNRHAPKAAVDAAADPPSSVVDTLARRGRLHKGGPAERERPFVLHSTDWADGDETLLVDGGHALTATPRILTELAESRGPERSLIALGYSAWGANQLEAEVGANVWLTVPSDPDITFMDDVDGKWQRAAGQVVSALEGLSGLIGHA